MPVDVLKFLNFLNEEKNIEFSDLQHTAGRVQVHRERKIPKRNPEKQIQSAASADGAVSIPSGNPETDEIKNVLSDSQKIQLEVAAKLFSDLHSKYNSDTPGLADTKTIKDTLKDDLKNHFLDDTGSKTPTTYTLKDKDGNAVWHMHVRHPSTTDRSLTSSGNIRHSHYGDLGAHSGDISFINAADHNKKFGVEVKTLGGYFGGGQLYSGEEPTKEDVHYDEETSKQVIAKHMEDMKNSGIRYVLLARRKMNEDGTDSGELDTKVFSTDNPTEDNHSLVKMINQNLRQKRRTRTPVALKNLPKKEDAVKALSLNLQREIEKEKAKLQDKELDPISAEEIRKKLEFYDDLREKLSKPEELAAAKRMYAQQIVGGNMGLQVWTQRIQNKFINERDWVHKVFENYISDGHSIEDMFELLQQG